MQFDGNGNDVFNRKFYLIIKFCSIFCLAFIYLFFH